jgi:hypothetical protein
MMMGRREPIQLYLVSGPNTLASEFLEACPLNLKREHHRDIPSSRSNAA